MPTMRTALLALAVALPVSPAFAQNRPNIVIIYTLWAGTLSLEHQGRRVHRRHVERQLRAVFLTDRLRS